MKFGSYLKLARQNKGLTQAELAQKAKVSESHISRYENGSAVPNVRIFVKLARALGVSAGFLLDGDISDDTY